MKVIFGVRIGLHGLNGLHDICIGLRTDGYLLGLPGNLPEIWTENEFTYPIVPIIVDIHLRYPIGHLYASVNAHGIHFHPIPEFSTVIFKQISKWIFLLIQDYGLRGNVCRSFCLYSLTARAACSSTHPSPKDHRDPGARGGPAQVKQRDSLNLL